MRLHRTSLFLRAYRFLPHRILNGAALRLSRARHPRLLVDAVIRAWIRRGNIDMGDFEQREYRDIEEFFLRRLRPGARPLGEGMVSPVDGVVVDAGRIDAGRTLLVKGRPITLERLVGHPVPSFAGGEYAVIFLTPDGYHRIHAPAGGVIDRVTWLPGRFFPQNDDALRHIARVYERNERAVLRLRRRTDAGGELLLVLVGASLVGGIELEHRERSVWARREPLDVNWPVGRGEEIAHFRFGSTVVLLLPAGARERLTLTPGQLLRMGESIAR